MLFFGREHWQESPRRLSDVWMNFARNERSTKARVEQFKQENLQFQSRVWELEAKLAQSPSVKLPVDEPPPGQQYGAGMIALCVNLGRKIGLRPTVRALGVFFQWLQVQEQIPTYQSIRTWMQRVGLDRVQRAQQSRARVWLTDHTNQLGKQKVLTVMRGSGLSIAAGGCSFASSGRGDTVGCRPAKLETRGRGEGVSGNGQCGGVPLRHRDGWSRGTAN